MKLILNNITLDCYVKRSKLNIYYKSLYSKTTKSIQNQIRKYNLIWFGTSSLCLNLNLNILLIKNQNFIF